MNKAPTVIPEVFPNDAQLRPVRDLLERGLDLQAHVLAHEVGPLAAWRGTAARLLAGRLAGQLGASRLGAWHFLRAARENPADAEACYFLLRRLQAVRGPLAAWTRLQRFPLPAGAAPLIQARFLTLQADLLSLLRDFDAAEACLARAEQLTPQSAAILLQRSDHFLRQDRHAEALALARESLERQPWYRPAVLSVADLLINLERQDEAVSLLRQATSHLESAAVWARLAVVQIEQEHHAEASEALDEYLRHSPLMEPAASSWLAGRRADCAYGLGDLPQALAWARQGRGGFWRTLVANLEQVPAGATPGRRLLPVGFVWQHHRTCAPATLAALCRFWSMPGEHIEMAEEIAYDGTPSHSQRRWAEANGWSAREFTVTGDNARALIDRGIPFALATAFPAGGHLQAVAGYDPLRRSLFLRDPNQCYLVEVLAEPFLESYRSVGPRGLALVPRTKAVLLDDLPLLDADLYDQLHQLHCALEGHDRAGAVRSLEALQAQAPGHRLTLQARRWLANYDRNPTEHLDALDRLLELFPADQLLQIAKVDSLRELGRRDERLAVVRKLCDRPAPDAVCVQLYARELLSDGREHLRTRHLLRQAIRRNPYFAESYLLLGNLLWSQRRFDEAFVLYRFAACLEDKGESYARAHFRAARCLGRTEEALAFLRQRFERFGRKSSLPARTLARSLADLERTAEALDVFEEALRRRPDDGGLRLQAADLCLERGRIDRAEELIAVARGRTHSAAWLRSAARLAGARGDVEGARRLWEQLLAEDPLALDAHRNLAELLAAAHGRPAALEHLRAAGERFPHNLELAKLCNEWLRDDDVAGAEAVVRRLLRSHPDNAWGHRELAVHLAKQGRHDEALAALEQAAPLEPMSCSLYSVRAFVLERSGAIEAAKAAYRQALLLDVDADVCIRGWLRLCHDLAGRREVLALVEEELARQVTFGDGVFAFQQAANRTFPPEEVLATLRRLLAARPDLWHAWSAVTDQLAHLQRAEEALPHAREAVACFPPVATLWTDLARVCYLRHDADGELAALRRALEINPSAGRPRRLLAECCERLGRIDEAHAVLERAVQLAPLSAANHSALSDVLWKMGRRGEAMSRLEHSLLLEPLNDSGWDRLYDRVRAQREPQRAIDLARRLTTARPTEARLWVVQARALALDPEGVDEALTALDRALALDPRLIDAHERKAELLCRARRLDEARAACAAAIWDGKPPLPLRVRAAIIEAEARDYPTAKATVREVLRDDPNSYRAWAYLADWSEATRTWPEYREAAEHMVRLAPHNSTPYGYRGLGRANTGDRAGAKDDWRHALYLAPDYAWAAFKLFDAHLEDSEFREAIRTLRHLRRYRRNEFGQARLCQLFARRRKRSPALRALRRLLLSRHEATWPVEAAEQACARAGWRADVDRLVAELLPDERCRSQAAILWGDHVPTGSGWESARALLPRALELLDREIAARPSGFRPHDIKALLLATAGRFAEAEGACDHPAQAESMGLRGRLAWVYAQAGNTARAVEAMNGVLRECPDYDWGWRRLAEWTEKLKDWPRHLEATENMVRLDPRSAVSYGYRGEARFLNGNRAGAKEDFRKSLEIDTGYGFGLSRLFDLTLEDGELDECTRCLEGLRRRGDDEFVWRRFGRLAVARKDRDGALAQLRRLCLSAHASPWPLQDLHDACRGAGWTAAMATTYAEVLPQAECRPQAAALWGLIADLSRLRQQVDLAARAHVLLDRAIAERPSDFKAYDVKAMVLGEQGRCDEAEAVCRSSQVAQLVGMRGRLAWVQRLRGRYTEAITLMRGCIAEWPEYVWGLYRLMDWAAALTAWSLRHETADSYIRASPQYAAGYVHRGHTRRDLGDLAGAKEDFRKALTFARWDSATALALVDVLLSLGELDEAARAAADINNRTLRLAAEMRLAARREQKAETLGKLRELCTRVGTDGSLLDDVLKAVEACAWQQDAEKTLEEALSGTKVWTNTGDHWVRLRTARQAWLTANEANRWADCGQPGLSVLLGLALALGRAGRGPELLDLKARHATRFREDVDSWARLGHALFLAGEFAEAAAWLRYWRRRKGVKPAALLDLALSFRALGRHKEAHAIHQHAQTLAADASTPMHELWLALDAARADDADVSRGTLAILAGGRLDGQPPYAWLRALIETLLDGRGLTEEQQEARFDELDRRLSPLDARVDDAAIRQVLRAAFRWARATVRDFRSLEVRRSAATTDAPGAPTVD
jgi:tetratricopeptide (TPR) repeat protein